MLQSTETEKKEQKYNKNIKNLKKVSKHLARRVLKVALKQCHHSHLGQLALSSAVVTHIEQQLIFFCLYLSGKRYVDD